MEPASDAFSAEFATEIFAASPDGVVVVDRSGTIVLSSPLAADMFGTTVEALIGSSVDELIPLPLRSGHATHRNRFAAASETRAMGVGLDLRALRVDGTTFAVDIALSPLQLHGQPMVLASVRDITDRKDAERQLRLTQERIATMEERERIARDLHDTVIQEIFAAGLTLQATMGRIDDPHVTERLNETVDRLDASIDKLRSVIFDLRRPSDQDDVQLVLDNVVTSAASELGFTPSLTIEGSGIALVDVTTVDQLIPTLREALTNVGKHAGASRVHIQIRVGDELNLTVVDDGVGISRTPHSGFGLTNMSDRAVSIGGRFSIGPADGPGTRLEWCVPITSDTGKNDT